MSKKFEIKKDVMNIENLQKIITKWISNKSKKKISKIMQFTLITEIEDQFKKCCLQYAILKKIPWIVSNLPQSKMKILDRYLKEQYRNLLLNKLFRSSNSFEILIVFLIKLLSFFLGQYFNNIKVDSEMQYEFCTIFYNTFLGITITEKGYEMLQNKYIPNSKSNRKDTNDEASDKASKKNSSKSIFLSHTTAMNIFSPLKTGKNFKKNRQSQSSFYRQLDSGKKKSKIMDQITQILKENLYVDPLPPLKKKMINIRQMTRMNTQPSQTQIKQRNSSFSNEKTKKYLFSNQLSSSIKSFHPSSLLFELNSKKVKLNQTLHVFKRQPKDQQQKEQYQKVNLQKKQKEVTINSKNINKKMDIQDWSRVVGNLKKTVYDLRQHDQKKKEKHDHQNSYNDEESKNDKKNKENIYYQNQIKQNTKVQQKNIDSKELQLKQYLSFKEADQISKSDYFKIEQYQRDSENNIEQCYYTNQFKRFGRILASNIIRTDQDTFLNLCKLRKASMINQKVNFYGDWNAKQHKK